ncbi:hypothetical protein [Kribbella kalugense]|uniref:Uncharacterized protein n=1 Tax=Kribbella kalugense TaxID=2512221 RepID=A0A4R7ZP56_9ACTN|nr:hypothetical protein [Kribbella kalugense]TDW19687.1 hypothetical protein EV650_6297 [Kribbella kalugense]
MPDDQELANLVLMWMLVLLPFTLAAMLIGRSRGNRPVLMLARVVSVVTIVLAIGYDVAAAVCLILAEPPPGHQPWNDPALATKYPYFYLPIGIGAFLAGLGLLVGVVRARHRLG